MEVERRMRFSVIENSMTRKDISASTFPGHLRCNSIPSCWVSMLRGVRFGHLYTSFPNWQRGEARAKDNNLYGVMIPYGKYLVNYAKELPWLDSWTMITSWHLSRGA